MLLVAKAVVLSALSRRESRGAHQREDYPGQDDVWTLNQTVSRQADQWVPVGRTTGGRYMAALNSRNIIHLCVQRGIGNSASHSEHFEIPEGVAASLLDGLRWMRANVDDTLTFRYSCINANVCKECMMCFDGNVVYACLARLQPGAVHAVAPLANKLRVRDLIAAVARVERLFIEGEDDGD